MTFAGYGAALAEVVVNVVPFGLRNAHTAAMEPISTSYYIIVTDIMKRFAGQLNRVETFTADHELAIVLPFADTVLRVVLPARLAGNVR